MNCSLRVCCSVCLGAFDLLIVYLLRWRVFVYCLCCLMRMIDFWLGLHLLYFDLLIMLLFCCGVTVCVWCNMFRCALVVCLCLFVFGCVWAICGFSYWVFVTCLVITCIL